ncbi:hypothetical protein SAMN04487905_11762 [Actinopolyspora xinjiangensis]|uniref:Small secreted domain n=1 Tax=Actinopolyspora xinjiangensis TaxID=405564 RepID=A0A1H0WXF4_9ACTN|nr:hypothetical protein [Actinopolyspora xinjiangensis]SDP95367.1 hypothetical protein SAMN04487905_11762 [Actinopolyspora xinjiangensis]
MKRTLTTVSALVAGSVGVLGFAGTAAAADGPELPAELPMDNNVAKATYHTAATLHSAQQVVGDVVPSKGKLTGRAADTPDGDPLSEAIQEGHVSGELLNGEQLDGSASEMLESVPDKTQQSSDPSSESSVSGLPVGDVVSGLVR